MKTFPWNLLFVVPFALVACTGDISITNNIVDETETEADKEQQIAEAEALLADAEVIGAIAIPALTSLANAISTAVDDAADAASSFQPAADGTKLILQGQVTLPDGGTITIDLDVSSVTYDFDPDSGVETFEIVAEQQVSNVPSGIGNKVIFGFVSTSGTITMATGYAYGTLKVEGKLNTETESGVQVSVTLEATITVDENGYSYVGTLGEVEVTLVQATGKLFARQGLEPDTDTPDDEPARVVCSGYLDASDYVTSVTSAQSVFDYQQTDEMVMGNALSDTTVCFSPALVGGGYDVFAAKTSNFPLLATNGSTGPAAEGMFVTVQLVNSFMFYGEEQTGFILNSSGTILFDLDSDNKSSNYIWPWFVDGEKAIIGSGWELESFPSPYTYREEDNKMVVSIVGTSANSDSGVMDMQMILDLATNEIILNYGRFGTGGIGAGIFAGTNFNDDGASVIVEYIPGTGVIYDPE